MQLKTKLFINLEAFNFSLELFQKFVFQGYSSNKKLAIKKRNGGLGGQRLKNDVTQQL